MLTKGRTYPKKEDGTCLGGVPLTRELHQYRRDNNPEIHIYRGSQTIDVEALFPGLELTTEMIFKLPTWAMH